MPRGNGVLKKKRLDNYGRAEPLDVEALLFLLEKSGFKELYSKGLNMLTE